MKKKKQWGCEWMSVPWWTKSKNIKSRKRKNKKIMEVSGQNSNERSKGQQKQEGGVDVLLCMFVTAAVFHLEMSTLNARA
jgi:hypothetical protein